jgi:hypothetical protein
MRAASRIGLIPEPHVAPNRLLFLAAIALGYIGHKSFRDLVSAYDLKVNHKPVVLVDLFSETGGLLLLKRRSRPTCSARRPMCRRAKCSGAGSDPTAGGALKSGRPAYSYQV